MIADIQISEVSWLTHRESIQHVRTEVFIHEQHVPVELEWDGLDNDCTHVIGYWQHEIAGTARLLADGHIGRMAVLAPYRGKRIGSLMLTKLIAIAQQRQLSRVFLHAQTSAINFYLKHEFSIISEPFMDADITHVTMQRTLEFTP